MKTYAIYNDDLSDNKIIGYLLHFEKANEFIIELIDDIDEWDVPILFQKYIREGCFTIPRDISKMWIKERVIPSGRQNIGMILKNSRLKSYDEMRLLKINDGRCSQDNCYINEENLPDHLLDRMSHNVFDCYITGEKKVICIHMDNSVRRVDLESIYELKAEMKPAIGNDVIYSVYTDVGGYEVVVNERQSINIELILKYGELLNISANELVGYSKSNLIATTDVCQKLKMTRQNLSYLAKKQKILPIIQGEKENLYTKGDIDRLRVE